MEEWQEIPQNTIYSLIQSMSRQCMQHIQVPGGLTSLYFQLFVNDPDRISIFIYVVAVFKLCHVTFLQEFVYAEFCI